METLKRILKKIFQVLLLVILFGLVSVVSLLIHELGHCFTMDAVGGRCAAVYVLPGVQVWPLSDFGAPAEEPWGNYFGRTIYAEPAPGPFEEGMVKLMGSGSVALISTLAMLALAIIRVKGWPGIILLIQGLFFLDIVTYTILPHFFDLPHFFIWGGTTPEPLDGALLMGIPEDYFILGVVAYGVFMLIGWIENFYQLTRNEPKKTTYKF